MYHGYIPNWDLVVFVFGAIAWMIRGIAKSARQFKQRGGTASQPPPAQALPPAQSPQSEAPPVAAVRERPRQQSAGESAVPVPATSRSFRQQEREPINGEDAQRSALSGAASVSRSGAPPNGLFSSTDDLIRAVILQEVLGPPLSRRIPRPAPSSEQSPPPPR